MKIENSFIHLCNIYASFYLPQVKLQNSLIFNSFGAAFRDTLFQKNDDGSFGPVKLGVGYVK